MQKISGTHILGLIILGNSHTRLATEARDLNRSNLVVESTGLLGSLGLLIAADSIVILLGTVEAVLLGALLGRNTHKILLAVGISQTILLDTINQGLAAKLGTAARGLQVVRGVRHGLGSTSDNNIGISGHDSLGTENDGLQARSADLVDSGADGRFAKTSTEGALSGGVLSNTINKNISLNCGIKCSKDNLPSRQDVTEEDLFDIRGIDALSPLDSSYKLLLALKMSVL